METSTTLVKKQHPFSATLNDLSTLDQLCELLNDWHCPARMGTKYPSPIDLDDLPTFSLDKPNIYDLSTFCSIHPDDFKYKLWEYTQCKSYDDDRLLVWGCGNWIIVPR